MCLGMKAKKINASLRPKKLKLETLKIAKKKKRANNPQQIIINI